MKQVPKYVKTIGVLLVIASILFNIYSIHKFRFTITSWTTYFSTAAYGTGIILILLAAAWLMFGKKLKAIHLFPGIAMSFAYYNILFGFIPFNINTMSASSAMTHTTSDFEIEMDETIVYSDDNYNDEISKNVHYDYNFSYKGYGFSKSSSDEFHQEVMIHCKQGLFGWEYIDEIELK